jgi:hypothetical protein
VIRLLGATGAAALLGIGAVPPPSDEPASPRIIAARAPIIVVSTYQGRTAHQWANRYHRLRRVVRRLQRVVLHKPTVVEAINLACATYGNCSTLWRKARCETGGTFSPTAKNRSSDASGLFQFLGSTWDSTPYGRFSVWSPYANALAAGWMHQQGRGGEWSCR